MHSYKGCYINIEDNRIIVGNSMTEYCLRIKDSAPVFEYLLNKQKNYFWKKNKSLKADYALINIGGFNFKNCKWSASSGTKTNSGRSKEFLQLSLCFVAKYAQIILNISVFPDLPTIDISLSVKGVFDAVVSAEESREAFEGKESCTKDVTTCSMVVPAQDTVGVLELAEKHINLTAVRLYDITDKNNNLVSEASAYLYREQSFNGEIFLLDAYANDQTVLIAREIQCIEDRKIPAECDIKTYINSRVEIIGSGIDFSACRRFEEITPVYGYSLTLGNSRNVYKYFKRFYSAVFYDGTKKGRFSMANTWGDRSQDTALNHDFILREIDAAKEMGVDILQIDDGWQKGITVGSKLYKGGIPLGVGVYKADKEFWQPDIKKFPSGLAPVVKYAEKNNIKIGLWFAPDSENNYKNWQIDAQNMINLYKTYNVQYFKLDGVRIYNTESEINFSKFMEKVLGESGNEINFNMDITSGRRFGYLMKKDIGTIFVENRYTDYSNYYPHSTLRNLWMLSKYIPANKLQIEFANLRRNRKNFFGDPFAPDLYTADYAFATSMFANPLFWMELQNLSGEDRAALIKINKVFRRISKELDTAIISPVGDIPNGKNFTGLLAESDGRGYVLLFRESTKESSFSYCLPPLKDKEVKLVCSNHDGVTVGCKNGVIDFNSKQMRTFALVSYS